jgi:hypothetical protein
MLRAPRVPGSRPLPSGRLLGFTVLDAREPLCCSGSSTAVKGARDSVLALSEGALDPFCRKGSRTSSTSTAGRMSLLEMQS